MEPIRIYQAASELLAQIATEQRPANEGINAYTRQHKSFGSKDRRLLTDTVWSVLRHQARLNWLLPKGSFLEKINLLINGLPDVSKALLWVQLETPEWLLKYIPSFETELPALLETPSIVLRANGNREEIKKALLQEGIETCETPLSPHGLILQKRANLDLSSCYKNGLIEVQDEGSQLVSLKTGVQPNACVLDYCAGAGGKSLIFAQMMQNKGKIVAHDISTRSLKELEKRAERAHVSCIDITQDIPTYIRKNRSVSFTDVVVDAPCSGIGTWRRCPDARWKLTEQQFEDVIKKQASLLQKASSFVAVQGQLAYMTCSLSQPENIGQVQNFLKRNKNFTLKSHQQFSPARTKTDGLFVALMTRVS